MKKLLCIMAFVLLLTAGIGQAQFNDSEKMFGQMLNLGHWSTDGLIGYWRFIEAGKLVDDSFSKLHGTLVDDPPWVGEALDFDGTDDYVSVPSDPRIENFTAITLGAWVNPLGAPGSGWGRIISKDQGGTSDDYALTYKFDAGGAYKVVCRINTSVEVKTQEGNTTVVPNTGWHFFVGTWDGVNVRVYLNGVLDGTSAATTGFMDDSNLPLGIGGHQASNTRRFDGLIRDAFIYDRALSASEIAALCINPDLPIIDEPIWLMYSPGEPPSGIVPIIQAHTRRRRAG